MVAIDLVPNDMKLGQARRKRLRLWIIVVLLVIISASMWSTIKYWNYRRATSVFRDSTQQYQEIQKEIETLSTAKNELDRWKDRIALLDEMGQYPNMVVIVNYLTQQVSPMVYFEEIGIAPAEKSAKDTNNTAVTLPKAAKMFLVNKNPGQTTSGSAQFSQNSNTNSTGNMPKAQMLYIKGKAVKYQDVADLMKTLSISGHYQNTCLKQTSRQMLGKSTVIEFEIECSLQLHPGSQGLNYANQYKTENF